MIREVLILRQTCAIWPKTGRGKPHAFANDLRELNLANVEDMDACVSDLVQRGCI